MQRERLLGAVAQAFGEDELNVTRIVELAGVGRATFYEFFDDAEHALLAVRERVLDRASRELVRVLDFPATRQGLEAVCEAWIELIRHDTNGALTALAALDARTTNISPLTELFARALMRWMQPLRTNTSARSGHDAHAGSSIRRVSDREIAAIERDSTGAPGSDPSTATNIENNSMWFALVLAQATAVRAARQGTGARATHDVQGGSPGAFALKGDLPRSLATAIAALLDLRDVTPAAG